MTQRDFKDLTIRKVSDKILHDGTFNILNNPKHDGYQRRLASMVWKVFDEKNEKMKIKLFLIRNSQKKCVNHLLENLKNEKCAHLL